MDGNEKKLIHMDNNKKARKIIGIAQCSGMIATILFHNGFILAYLSRLGIDSANILIYLSIPTLVMFLIMLPSAFLSDRLGKKKVGATGLLFTVLGYFLITAAGGVAISWTNLTVISGIIVFSAGYSMFMSGWYALLAPLVPRSIRGGFFGKLRFSINISGIMFTLIVTAILKTRSDLSVYMAISAMVTVLLIVRLLFYSRIPEISTPDPRKISFFKALSQILRERDFLGFCSYCFLLSLFTGSLPWIFGLLEKDVLNYTEHEIVLLGNILFVGLIAGFYFGGKLVDRFGTKMIFLFCHLTFFTIIFLFVARNVFPIPVFFWVAALTMCLGMVRAASEISIATEMMALMPRTNQSLATSFNGVLVAGGVALSGILGGKIMDLNILNKSWTLLGREMSDYDSLLLGCGVMIILLIITLGLIPSVMRSSGNLPRKDEGSKNTNLHD